MDRKVIRWKLNELMAQKRIRNKDLATVLGISENSVYRLRRTDEMPRLSPDRLNGICEALVCQPGDLLSWEPDEPPNKNNKSDTPKSSRSDSDLSPNTPKDSGNTKAEAQKAA
ncbi:MAG: helix-turn-helix domain-containing protein [Symploca sp. SIO2G7]|nr:helix-turn-helix domain-containing protein [Symploca sp. SIO2G7]